MTYTREQLLEAADILDKAHDVILDKGWWPGDAGSGAAVPGWHCMESAVNVACGATDEWSTCCSAQFCGVVPDWMRLLFKDRGIDFHWNDAAERTSDEVFDRLRTVAKELREEAGVMENEDRNNV